MHGNLADLFEAAADRVPDAIALARGAERCSYASLEVRANRFAHALFARGVRPGEAVVLHLGDGAEHLEAMLGCFKLRAVAVHADRGCDERALRSLLAAAGAVAIVHERAAAASIAAARGALPGLRVALSVDDGSGADLTRAGSEDFESALAGASQRRAFPWAAAPEADARPRA